MAYQNRTVNMFDSANTETTIGFGKELAMRFKVEWGLEVATVNSDDDASGTPLLLLCQNYSRIGTDIDAATSKLSGSNKARIAVIVIHTKEKHALPATNPTENLYDEKYDAFGRLIDFAYTHRDKIYPCRMNTDGDRKLKEFLTDKIPGLAGRGRQIDRTYRNDDEEPLAWDLSQESRRSVVCSECPWLTRQRLILIVVIVCIGLLIIIIVTATRA